MSDPVVIEVVRGGIVESRHRGAIAIVDAGGRPRVAIGDVDQAVFPRSAVKALQALPLVESGAADRYGFGNAELALACASHSGESRHVATAMRMLGAAGRGEADLACGVSWPADREAANALVRAGKSRARSTTIAPASIRASSASPATWASTPRATCGPTTRSSAR